MARRSPRWGGRPQPLPKHPWLRGRHGIRLVLEIGGYAAINRVWWIIPMMLLLLAIALVIVVGQAAAPVTLYPMF